MLWGKRWFWGQGGSKVVLVENTCSSSSIGSHERSISRKHFKPRANLFTPIDVAGFPESLELIGSIRVSKGMTLDGRRFEIWDDWANPTRSHLHLGVSWIGSTTFLAKRRY